jgi:hypothetical protein
MGSAVINNALATQVKEEHPSTNYDAYTKLPVRDFTNTDVNTYLWFSKPFPNGVNILLAEIVFYTLDEPSAGGSRGFKFTRLDKTFSASKMTYNTRPTTFISGDKPITKSTPWADKTEWRLDVTDWMQTAANGGFWGGYRIIPTTFEDNVLWMYSEIWPDASLRPRLEVTWSDAPSIPVGMSPSGGRAVSVAKPIVRATFKDVSGNTTLAAVQVQANATDVWTAPSFDSGAALSSVPELDLNGSWPRTVSVITNGTTTITAAVATFEQADVGATIVGTNIPGGATITAVASGTSATISATASGSGTNPTTITRSFAGLADGASIYWRIRFRDGGGAWSSWSTSALFTRDIKGVLTVFNPPTGAPVYGTGTVTAWQAAILGSLLPAVGGTPPVWQSSTTQAAGTGTTSVCNYPATGVANDIFLWQQYIEPDGSTVTAPDGTWTKIAEVDQLGDGADDFRVQWWYKRATGGETGAVTFTHASLYRRASLHRITGAVTTGNPFEGITTALGTSPSKTSPMLGFNTLTDRLMIWGGGSFNPAQTWTPPTGYTERLDAGETSLATKLGSTVNPVVEDATPPISWLLTGETQAAYQVQITHLANGIQVLDWDTKKITGTLTSLTVPSGAINEPTNTTYTVTVRIWDTKQRENMPGDTPYVEVVRLFTYVPGPATGTTGLTAVADLIRPKVVLTWTSATMPDAFNILRNGKVIAADLLPTDLLVSGTTYTYTDHSPSPKRLLTYEVQRVVNNVASASNATAQATATASDSIWLRDPTTGLEVCIRGRSDRDFELGEEGVVLQAIAPNSPKVAINQTLGGIETPIEGELWDVFGRTAQQWRDDLIKLRQLRVKRFWLTISDYTFLVVCQQFKLGKVSGIGGKTVIKVSFMAYQQDSILSMLSTA